MIEEVISSGAMPLAPSRSELPQLRRADGSLFRELWRPGTIGRAGVSLGQVEVRPTSGGGKQRVEGGWELVLEPLSPTLVVDLDGAYHPAASDRGIILDMRA